jgi:NAD-dependent deacetylase
MASHGGENSSVPLLAQWLAEARHVVVLTGAGMSTESGVPDFRSPSGWWRKLDPTTVATVEAYENRYDLFHAFYKARIEGLEGLRPHRGHEILAEWEQRGLVQAIVTQNVDGFHQLAGSTRVIELHGSIRTCRCGRCGAGAAMEEFLAASPCPRCGGRLRPNVVLFGEMLPEDAWREALAEFSRADLVIAIGTSLAVSPANQLPMLTGGQMALINLEPTEMDGMFQLVITGKAGEVLAEVDRALAGMDGRKIR